MMLIEDVEQFLNGLIPEGRFKDFLRRQYRWRYNPYHVLDPLVVSAQPSEDGSLLVELIGGFHLRGPRDDFVYRTFRYADPAKLKNIGHLGMWSIFLVVLSEEFGKDVYELERSVKPGDTVLDLGAHIGGFTVRAARKIGPAGRVIAVEPAPQNYALLRSNLALNDLSNVEALNLGVWKERATLTMHFSGLSGGHSVEEGYANVHESGDVAQVPVDSVDGILAERGIERVDFVKMDIEGAEIEAIKGMRRTLERSNARLAIAAYHRVDGQQTHHTVTRQLAELGYRSRVQAGIVLASRS
jgi:FkbM family methyltransferase